MYFREYNQTRFLIVDANIKLRLLMEDYLKSFGAWFIDLAADGVEAIDKCQQGIFDVIICDYNLGTKNGQQVLEELRIRKLQRATSLFIMMSADTTKDMVLGAVEYQPDAYITKPITRDSFKQRMDSLLMDSEALYDIKYAIDCNDINNALYLCDKKIAKGSKYSSWCQKTQAQIYLQKKDYDNAKRIYLEVLKTRPVLWARLGLVRVAIAQSEFSDAESELNDIISKNPLCLPAYDLLADVLLELGKKKLAQTILFEAVSHSPRAIQRHVRLGEVAQENQDFDIATEAFRNAIEHGEQSIFQNANNYLNFARCLHDTATTLERPLHFSREDEALGALNTAETRYGHVSDVRFQSNMISARIHLSCERNNEAENALKKAQQFYMELALELPPRLSLEYAQTLFTLGKEDEAELVLNQVKIMHGQDDEIAKKIEDMRDEPVAWQDKQKAAELNRMGIQMTETGNMAEAIRVFQDALAYSPRHPALNLNLVQVLLKKILAEQDASDSISLCEQCLKRLAKLPEDHKQYKRFQFLQKKLRQLVAA